MIRAHIFRATVLVSLLSVAGCISPQKLNAKGECLHEDFVNRVSAAGQCLVLDNYESPSAGKAPLLVVFVHGDGTGNRGYRWIERIVDAIPRLTERNIVLVALTHISQMTSKFVEIVPQSRERNFLRSQSMT